MFHEWPRVLRLLEEAEQIAVDGCSAEMIALKAAMLAGVVIVTEKVRSARRKHHNPGPELLTCKEAAAELRLNEETVRVLARRRELPCVRLGRAMRIPRAGLDRFKRERGEP